MGLTNNILKTNPTLFNSA